MKFFEPRQPFSFPLRVDHRGRTADDDWQEHVRHLIEQLLFTIPGERVNRPTFGTDIHRAVFSPNSEQLATALEHMVRAALQGVLSEHLTVEAVTISPQDSVLRVEVRYRLARREQSSVVRLERTV